MKGKIHSIGIALLLAAALFAAAQDVQTDRVTVPLSNPGKPATISVELLMGSIKVVGYEGKDVIVEATPREHKIEPIRIRVPRAAGAPAAAAPVATPAPAAPPAAVAPPAPTTPPAGVTVTAPVIVLDAEKEKSRQEKAAGMKRIPVENTGLTVEESDNVVTVRVESFRRAVDLILKVPYATSLKLVGTNLEEAISVDNISGDIEIRGSNGGVALKGVSGTVVAATTNGDIEATMAKVTPDKPMSFVTFNGDVDITLPADTKATFNMKSAMGEYYSDFDVTLKPQPVKAEKSEKAEKGKFRISLDRGVSVSINGGGPEFKLQTYNGNIYIRKKK